MLGCRQTLFLPKQCFSPHASAKRAKDCPYTVASACTVKSNRSWCRSTSHLTVSIRLMSAHMQTAHPQSTCGANAASTMDMGQSHSIQQVKHKKADQCAYQGRCYCQQHDLESCFVDSAAAAVAAAGHAWLHAWRHKPLASFLQTHLLLLPHQLLHMPACYLYQPHQTGQMVAWLNPHHPREHAGVGNLTAYGLCLCPACQSCAPGLM